MIKDAFGILERMAARSYFWGAVCVGLSTLVLLAIWIGAFTPNAFGGHLKDGAVFAFLLGWVLVIIDAVRTVLPIVIRCLTYPFRKMREKAENARELEKLRENARYFITDLERLILYVVHDQPSHRMPMFTEYRFFSRLIGYGLLKFESGSEAAITGTEILQLNNLIADDHKFWSEFRERLIETYGEDLPLKVGELVKDKVTEASGY